MSQVKTIREYDAKGNCIHCRYSNGFECWREYDANFRIIHYLDNWGYEKWYWKGEETEEPIKILLLQKQLRDKVNPS